MDLGAVVTCAELNQILCPQINCCTPCAPVVEELYSCLFLDAFALIPGSDLANCQIDCSGFPFTDEVDPTCDPQDYVCVDLYADYIQCYSQCEPVEGCTGIAAGDPVSQDLLDLTLQQAAVEDDECAILNAVVCPEDGSLLDDCCPQCDGLLANFYQCQVNIELETPCNLECATGEASSPSTPASPEGSTAEPASPEGSTTEPASPEGSTAEAPSGQPEDNPSPSAASGNGGRVWVALAFILVVAVDHLQ
jgi:hypothetical protein